PSSTRGNPGVPERSSALGRAPAHTRSRGSWPPDAEETRTGRRLPRPATWDLAIGVRRSARLVAQLLLQRLREPPAVPVDRCAQPGREKLSPSAEMHRAPRL